MKQQIILADTQAIFRTGIARVLSKEPGLHVAAQCASIECLLETIATLRKAVVIFPSSIAADLSSVIDRILHAGGLTILILEHGDTLDDALQQRVQGVVLRSVDAPQLVDCIRRVAAGERSVQRSATVSPPAPDRVGTKVLQRLTPRELEIIALVTEGAKNKEIATQLGTKEQVIKNYLRSIYDKTGVSDRLELALYTVHHRALAEAAERVRPQRAKPS